MSQSSKTNETIDNYDSKSFLGYDAIINASYGNDYTKADGNTTPKDQHVNILMDYPWTVDKFSLGGVKVGVGEYANIDIPHCYAVEYKQLHNGTITNLINSLSAGFNAIRDVVNVEGGKKQLEDAMQNISDLYSSLTNSDNNNQDKKSDSDQGKENDQQSNTFFGRIQKTFNDFDGVVIGDILFFITPDEFKKIPNVRKSPKVNDAIMFDNKPCIVTNVVENMGMYEVTLQYAGSGRQYGRN